ncbi:MAG TPA: signal peptidase I [Opitutales bacterium]|nr:signal peptidase I [Opitutales bacterium]
MFFFWKSATARAREQAQNLLLLAHKVDCYRRDVVPAAKLAALREAVAALEQLLADKKTKPEALDHASEALHQAMLPCGGDIYPLTVAGEYTEMIIVAAIVVIGIRTFFLQPFRIPTNSMYPTYNGMTPYVYALDAPGPSAAQKAWNFLTLGATHYDLRAPVEGEVTLPLGSDGFGRPAFGSPNAKLSERNWTRLWIVPVDLRQYAIFVGNQPVAFKVPMDFNYGVEEAFVAEYFPDLYAQGHKDLGKLYGLLLDHHLVRPDGHGGYALYSGHIAHAGDRVLDFDLRTGDMLFVDRFSYNFITPRVGDPFVFHTQGISRIVDHETGQVAGDQYYIKRLVGRPGDRLEVREPVLYRNSAPITGAAAFDKNAQEEGEYPGYVNRGDLGPGDIYTVPENGYFAMGDNSPDSEDSRYWGPVPAQNLVGRAVFIIYPFTSRWGPAH